MAKVPTARRGKAFPKRSTDGFMGRGSSGIRKMGATSDVKLGPELFRDPTFYYPERLTVGTEWTVGFGKATGVPATSSAITSDCHLLEAGEDYQVELHVAAGALGTVKVQFTSGTDVDSSDYGPGEHVFTLTANTGNNNIALRKDIAFDGDVTFLSVRKITT